MLRFFQILLLFSALLWSSCEQIFRYTEPESSDSASVDLATGDGGQDVTLADSSASCPDGQMRTTWGCRCTPESCPTGCCSEGTQTCVGPGEQCSSTDCTESICDGTSHACELQIKDGSCYIDNHCYSLGAKNSIDQCLSCSADARDQWSIQTDCVHTLAQQLSSSPVDVDVDMNVPVPVDKPFPIYVAANDESGHGHLLEVDELLGQAKKLSSVDELAPILGLAFYENGAPLLAFSQPGLSCIQSLNVSTGTIDSLYACDVNTGLVSAKGLDAADGMLAIVGSDESNNSRLVLVNPTTSASANLTFFPNIIDATFVPKTQNFMLLDKDGTLYLSHVNSSTLQFDLKGFLAFSSGQTFNGIAARSLANGTVEVFISSSDNCIYNSTFLFPNDMTTISSTLKAYAGDSCAGLVPDASFNTPMGLAIGGPPEQPQLIIADSGNNVIQGIYLEP